MKRSIALIFLALTATAGVASASESASWPSYLDYAYVYSSAEPEALRERLDGIGVGSEKRDGALRVRDPVNEWEIVIEPT